MTERKLTVLPVEIDGYCDPESGVCEVPAAVLGAAAEAAEPDPVEDAARA